MVPPPSHQIPNIEHSFDQSGICPKCGCSESAVRKFGFLCNKTDALDGSHRTTAKRSQKKGTNLLGTAIWLAPACFVIGFIILAGAQGEETNRTAAIVAAILIFGAIFGFLVAWLIDEETTPAHLRKLTSYSNHRSRKSYGKLTAAASLYAAGQLRQINEKLDHPDSGDGSGFGGF